MSELLPAKGLERILRSLFDEFNKNIYSVLIINNNNNNNKYKIIIIIINKY